MSDNNFQIKLQAMLDKVRSLSNIKADIKAIESKLTKIKIKGTLDKSATQKELNTKIKSINPNKVKIDADTTQAEKNIKKLGKQKTDTTITPKVDNTQVVSGLKQAQKETKTLWERFMSGAIGVNLVRMAVQRVTQAIKEAISTVKELDAIKTNIQMVSGTSDSGVNDMMSSYNAMAKELSSTTKDVAEAANEFLRMGESVDNTNELIRSSQVLSKVGMIQSSEAVSYLISSLKGYHVAVEDSMNIVSKLTSVDLEAAVSAGGLAEALSKCANIADNSGVTMDRLIGYTATIGETTQKSMSEVGNSFQALLSRMNNIKIGRFIDDETGESLSDTEAVLNKLGIQLRDTENTYRSFDDVLDDVGSRWESLTKVEQNALSVAIAGTRQRENFEALMNNWANALKYSETAANSAGSALERYGVFQDSIEAKTNELTAAMESLSTNIISEELYSGIIEATTGIVEFLDKTNLLKGTLVGIIAMGISKTFVSIGAGFVTAAKSTAQLSAAMAMFNKGTSKQNLLAIGAACKGLSDQQLKLVLSTKGLEYEDRRLILAGKGVAKSEQKQTLTTLGFGAAEDKATISTFSLKGAIKSLGAVIATNPIGVIVTAVSVATMIFTGFNSAMEEARQKTQELGDEFKSTKSDIEDYKSKIEELQKTINDSNSSIEDVTSARKTLMSVQDELIKKFGTEKETIEIITDAINNQSDALDLLTKKQYLQWKNNFNNKDFGTLVSDFIFSDNFANAFYKLTEFDFSGAWEALTYPTESNISKMVNSMQHAYYTLEKTGNDTLDSLIAKKYNLGSTGSNFVLRGNLNDVYETLLGIQELANDFNVSSSFKSNAEKLANSMDKTLESYKESYDIYVLYDKILYSSKDNPYDEQFNLINKAKEKFDEASILGDTNKIKEAGNEYAQTLQSAIDLAIGNRDQDVADYFKSMYPELQQMFGEWKFNLYFEPNTDGLKDKVTNALDAIDGTSDSNASFSVEDIESFNLNTATQEQIDAYGDLTSVAESYGLTLKQLIALLQTMGLVQSESYQRLVDTFGQENVDKLSSEDLEIAYTIKNIGNMSFDELCSQIERLKILSKEPASFSDIFSLKDAENNLTTLGELNDQLDKIQAAYKNLSDAMDTYTSTGHITIDQFQAIVEQGSKFLDYLELEDGQLDLNKQAMYKLAEARIVEMKAQMIQGVVNNVSKIENETDAVNYLATTNYKLAESYHALAEDQITAWEKNSTLSKESKSAVVQKAMGDIDKIKALVAKIDLSSIGDKASSTAKSFTDALDKELTALDKKMEAGYVDFNDYIHDRLALIEDYYKQGKIKADEYYSYLEKHYDTQLSYRDKVVNAVTRRIDAEIDALKQQKDDVENIHNAQIESLEKEKTLLEEANKERQRQIDLQKSLYDLERARNQRTKLVYSEDKGMHYVADDQSIRDAQENVDNAKYNIQISEIENSISKLEEARDKQTDAIEDMISDLEAYKDAWKDITSAYEDEQENLIAAQILGANWENDILNGRLDVLDAFKNQYIAIQQAMTDAAWKSANEQAKAAKAAEKGASGSTGNDGTNDTPPPNKISSGSLHNLGLGSNKLIHTNFKAYASGIDGLPHDEKNALVSEYGQSEMTVLPSGSAVITDEPTLMDLPKDTVIYNEEQTKKIIDNKVDVSGNAHDDGTSDGNWWIGSDGHKYRDIQPGDRAWELQKAFEPLLNRWLSGEEKILSNAVFDGQKQMEKWVKEITNNTAISNITNNRNVQQPVVQNITLNCPNVTNNSGVEYLQKELGHLSLIARQEPLKKY